jgi:hypothetical protein
MEPAEQRREVSQLLGAIARLEEVAEVGDVSLRRLLQLPVPVVGEHGVGHAPVGRAVRPVDPALPLEPVEEPGHARGGEDQLLGQVDAPQTAVLGPGEEEEALEVVDRQPVVGDELGVHRPRCRRLAPEQVDPGLDRRCLLSQYLTRQSSLATIACVINYSALKEEWKWQF